MFAWFGCPFPLLHCVTTFLGGEGTVKSTNYYRTLRKRWWVLALGLAVGVLVATVTQPTAAERARAKGTLVWYKASNTMLISAERSVPPVDYGRITLYATKGTVPERVRAELGASRVPTVTKGSPANSQNANENASSATKDTKKAQKKAQNSLQEQTVKFYNGGTLTYVLFQPNKANGSLVISVTSGSKTNSAKVANVYARQLSRYLVSSAQTDYDASLAALQTEYSDAETELQSLEGQLLVASVAPQANTAVLEGRRDAQKRRVASIAASINATTLAGPNRVTVTNFEPASPERVDLLYIRTGSEPPSGWLRIAMGASIGFLLAIAIVVLIEIIAAHVRDVRVIENAAKLPVITEIPEVDFDRRVPYPLATVDEPSSLSAEAYRTLRTSVLAMWRRHPVHHNGSNPSPNGAGTTDPSFAPLKSLLITSPGPAEGKSVTVANLAATLAETGMTVIAIDADFRRPTLDKYLGGQSQPDLLSLGRDCTREQVLSVIQQTKVPGVGLIATKRSEKAPGESVAVVMAVVAIAQELADIVIVDSPPLLLANDSADIATAVDATVLLARSGWTRRGAITAAADLLRRVGANIIGITLVAAERGARYGYYGGYNGYGYGGASYYSYGTRSNGRRSPTILVKMLPRRPSRRERERVLDLRTGAEEDLLPPTAVPTQRPPSDDEWVS